MIDAEYRIRQGSGRRDWKKMTCSEFEKVALQCVSPAYWMIDWSWSDESLSEEKPLNGDTGNEKDISRRL